VESLPEYDINDTSFVRPQDSAKRTKALCVLHANLYLLWWCLNITRPNGKINLWTLCMRSHDPTMKIKQYKNFNPKHVWRKTV